MEKMLKRRTVSVQDIRIVSVHPDKLPEQISEALLVCTDLGRDTQVAKYLQTQKSNNSGIRSAGFGQNTLASKRK